MTVLSGQQADHASRYADEVGPVIDTDVHVTVPGIEALLPYLEPRWHEFLRNAGFTAPDGYAWTYPPGAPTTGRRAQADGPGDALRRLQDDVLDRWNCERVVLNCYYGAETIRHPDLSAALSRAVNHWLAAEWLDKDDRLRASLVIGGFDIEAAVREVDRAAEHPGFVQVLLPVRSERPYGTRYWHPLFRAIERNDLVAGFHFGGMQGNPPTPSGWPTYYLEEYVGMAAVFQSQVTSVVVEGLLEVVPRLRIALLEGGFTWLPSLLWRLDKEWKGLRRETPWVRRAPSEYVREHFRASTQPLDMAGDPAKMREVLSWLGDDMLMFATDHPHRHAGHVDQLLDLLSLPQRRSVMSGCARDFYRF